MEVNLAHALGAVRLAVGDAAQKAARRRLTVYGDKVPCRPGCHGCCSRLLNVTVAEGILMYESLLESGDWPGAKEVALRQFRLAQASNALSWFKMNLKCPALSQKDGTCMAYSVRPAKCSTHFVTSPPPACDPWSPEGGEYAPADMLDIVQDFDRKVEGAVDGHGIFGLTVPIPVALLVAERIRIQSGLSLPEAISLLYNELR